MLFRKPFLEGIAKGQITVAFRRWQRPTVKAGGTLNTSVGVLAIKSVEPVTLKKISEADALAAGFESKRELLDEVNSRDTGELYRIDFTLAGDDPRIALREDDELDAAALATLQASLARMDAVAERTGGAAWTLATLRLIAANDGVRAGDLAAQVSLEKDDFKIRVRRLKNLGLTESLGTGYRISPRGQAVLCAVDQR